MSTLERDPRTRVQILADDGSVLEDAEPPDLGDEELIEIYHQMRLARHFDQRAVSLQRQGRMGTYPPLSGQEGAQIASAHALDEDDWLFPSYREHGAGLVRGLSLERTLLYWMGHEEGNAIPEGANIFTVAVPIASQIPHAVGHAWAAKLKGDDTAAICYFGDGATSEGDFHEGLNFAGVFDTPNVFFCNNNQWAISVPRERQTASETLAQKATAYGFEGVQVDGMDPLAVYKVTREAVEKSKSPDEGELRPTLIEAVQYRFGAHTTADDPSVYREDDEVEEWTCWTTSWVPTFRPVRTSSAATPSTRLTRPAAGASAFAPSSRSKSGRKRTRFRDSKPSSWRTAISMRRGSKRSTRR